VFEKMKKSYARICEHKKAASLSKAAIKQNTSLLPAYCVDRNRLVAEVAQIFVVVRIRFAMFLVSAKIVGLYNYSAN
jgi:hypothetical protein